ncbi:hypothetical protein KC332_g4985 [Hortaea werneckii]|nr:hypothetical protein KC358_g17839 [Hortaea werneckii]KAI6823228.1 hypothetical protein KC350_g9261 [Hortaea werneckii]KAI6921198.1 hypothetical protein KC348_g10210 [Hortaea werneckii]KAI6931154.1 hypothetical protein KC341_g9775 [Hortaea werneckii]KAI6965531.1 hypothetical protein KC321_g10055 [Hortaea werneckii]
MPPKRRHSPSSGLSPSSKRNRYTPAPPVFYRNAVLFHDEHNSRSIDPSRASFAPHADGLDASIHDHPSDTEMPDAITEHVEGATQGIVNDPLEFSNAILVDNSVRKKLLVAAQRTPRFLFRAFRSDSDQRCENTLGHVYPLALQNEAPLMMFDIPKRTLAGHALHHLKNVYELSRNELLRSSPPGECHAHLAVIDTKRLPSHIIALHSSAFRFIDKRIPKVPTTKHKFLIYGRIQGSAYKAVPFGRMLTDGVNWLAASMEEISDPEVELRLARDFGQLFGAYFKIPVTAMLLAGYKAKGDVLKDPEWMEFLVRALQNFEVPAEWAMDATIMGDIAITACYRDVSRAIRLLRALVVARFGKQDPLPALAETSSPGLHDLLRDPGQEDEDNDAFATSSEASSDQSDLSADEEVAGPAMPPGVMDAETKRSVQEAMERTPRYLFRYWNNDADRPSGGFKGLNTVNAITPLAYLRGRGSDSIYDLTREDLTKMVAMHLTGHNVLTELSSWASSLAVCFTMARGNPAHGYISIIDTRSLSSNTIMHVPSLQFVNERFTDYGHEYLAHSVIRGPAHRAALADELRRTLRILSAPRPWPDPKLIRPSVPTRTRAEKIVVALGVGKLYGDRFVVPVTVALLTYFEYGKSQSDPGIVFDLPTIIEALKGYKIPRRLCADASILTEIVHTKGYERVRRMILVLRALIDHYHGRGARARARSPTKPQTYVRRSSLARTDGYQFNRGRSSIGSA